MSRRAIKSINWAAIAERLTEAEKNNFVAFKAKADQHLRRMSANPESLPKIDWAFYKKNIASATLVDTFQKQYESISIPYPEDKYTSQIDAAEKQMNIEIEALIKKLHEHTEECKQNIEKLESIMPVSEMTLEEFAIHYPEDSLSPQHPTCWPHEEGMEDNDEHAAEHKDEHATEHKEKH